MKEIKQEILDICKAFNLGEFKNLISNSENVNGYIMTEFETNTGFYKHYFRVGKQ